MAIDTKHAPPERRDADVSGRNPFQSDLPAIRPVGALANAEQQKAIAEVQARMIIARSNPRNQVRCMDAILQDCTRPSLAKDALYQYARGGSAISGPSIRLAESIARRWGNIASGIKEVSRADGYSECVAYAWDLETGFYDERQYQVKHWRDTKSGGYQLTDERDIYELIANMGQRRKRAVLLTVIPGDVVEAAVDQCEETLNTNADTSPEALGRMVKAFEQYSVTKEQIEKRCQCRIEAVRPAQIVQLSKIFASLKDGMSDPGDWFDMPAGSWKGVEERHAAAQRQPETKDTPAPSRAPAPRKAAAKKAATQPQDDGPPDDGRWGPPLGESVTSAPATPEPLAQVATPAAEEERANLTSAAEAPSFEEWLLDAAGDAVGEEPSSDPVEFARAAVSEWEKTMPPDRDAWQDHNGGAIENARQVSTEAAQTFDAAWSVDSSDAVPGVILVPLSMDRGKPSVGPYLKAFKQEVAGLVAANFPDFIEMNRGEMAKVPASTLSLCLKDLVLKGTELGVPVPPDLGPSLLGPRPAPATGVASTPAGVGAPRAEVAAAKPGEGSAPSAGPEAAPEEDPDWRAARFRAQELKDCKDAHEFNAMVNGIILKNFGARMQREGKMDIIAFVKQAADEARARLGISSVA